MASITIKEVGAMYISGGPVEPKTIFFIADDEEKKFIEVLQKYWQFYRRKTKTEAEGLAKSSYEYLIKGLDLVGNTVEPSKLTTFDTFLSDQTDHFYTPTDANRKRYKKGARLKKSTKPAGKKGSTAANGVDLSKIDRIRDNLLSEYPALDRKDLQESIENYCRLIVKVNDMMVTDAISNNVAIKNLTDTMIKLGGFLGIDEEKKAKQKALEDKQSVASLSAKFQQTLDEYPVIMDRMKYEELRILLEKLDANSLGISKELFESPAYAGMEVQKAREFIKEREAKYESKDA